ncbi:MAG: cytochrome c biogenesis protein CcdA [Deltaproteobacteria bacterium]|nr:cytochrome c biogenesis protein CcdA [Deltaproteobacteria bacterium]MBW2084683.1 cytochrome c biogenesis protein CcdA [Deltaproteobacteria bacterium]
MTTGSAEMSYFIAFTAGFLSFISPCVLPLIPGYLSFITGFSFEDVTDAKAAAGLNRRIIVQSLLFIAGFSMIFILLGLSVTALGKLVNAYQDLIRQVGGVIVILLGLYMAGLLPTRFLNKEKRVILQKKPAGAIGSFLVGVTFGVGWTPCVGPILASVLIFASTKNSFIQGFTLLLAYTLGLALPFFISALALDRFLSFFRRFSRWMRWVGPVSGLFLVVMGILIFFDLLAKLIPGSLG